MANKQIHEKKKQNYGHFNHFMVKYFFVSNHKIRQKSNQKAKIAKKPLIFNCQVLNTQTDRQTDRQNHKNYLFLK